MGSLGVLGYLINRFIFRSSLLPIFAIYCQHKTLTIVVVMSWKREIFGDCNIWCSNMEHLWWLSCVIMAWRSLCWVLSFLIGHCSGLEWRITIYEGDTQNRNVLQESKHDTILCYFILFFLLTIYIYIYI